MTDTDLLVERFEAQRPRLRAVAHRMLGSAAEADDAVQDTWLRLSRADVDGIDNLPGWLTTTVGRVCLDRLRSGAARHEESTDTAGEEPAVEPAGGRDPEQEALLAESVGQALEVVLTTLGPTERLVFVLHDMFAVSFDEIAPVVDRSPPAVRQIASRARRRVQSRSADPVVDPTRQRRVVEAFLAASREGRFEDLVGLLDPYVVLRGDAAAVRMGGSGEVRGSSAVADFFNGRAQGAVPAYVDGAAGALVIVGGTTRLALSFVVTDRIIGIEVVADPEQLRGLAVVVDR
ncbi:MULTISPECIES: sigma-70 family RNA polymerase sigma factor [Micromonospora]|uniref:Sigma-70 family RNA polymerase sigma factor n=1 Tax=Micromonospora solifontis TaxID=2487138 RepID=A0ABX9WF38_9ACTN|nr:MULTISPECIES: sigma-70 family RNA polymerase sigma factor [Micromonospora]NES16704.1 sigma-70 family RNA polymerase sigma factor [Micromonospora sp. PPF5-17B]NES37728.1 sigma-70 family RNA polymerase sigma factor [Micromonospora solifontis]NES58466.1 sigma-70 family RNA polymerase sigma factor [Micromonospora sp. PPF5-6]RNL98077.1 sigma-70 family RNA polymerase sigma factor [Micromonospora solifontis]